LAALFTVTSFALILVVLWDAFEAVVLPRRVTRRFRLTRLFYRSTWRPWSALARQVESGKKRETYLSFFGPMSLLLLLSVWALGLVVGFGMLQWSLDSPLNLSGGRLGFGTYVYLSGTTLCERARRVLTCDPSSPGAGGGGF